MVDLIGKVICNKFVECDVQCSHKAPHTHHMICRLTCNHGGECVDIKDRMVDGALAYVIDGKDGNYQRINFNSCMDLPKLIDLLPKHTPEQHIHERTKRFLNLEL